MYHKKEELATLLFEALDDLILGEGVEAVSIDRLITPNQKYHLIMNIINALPPSNMEMVREFNNKFEVERETTTNVLEFQHGKLRFRLLLEEVLELGAALGMSFGEIYKIYVELQDKVNKSNIIPSLVEVLDALTDITYVNEGALDVFNLSDISWEAMENVHNSNMSKLVPANISDKEYYAIIDEFTDNSIPIRAKKLPTGQVLIKHKDTNKVLKPKTYTPATLENILNSHLKNITKL